MICSLEISMLGSYPARRRSRPARHRRDVTSWSGGRVAVGASRGWRLRPGAASECAADSTAAAAVPGDIDRPVVRTVPDQIEHTDHPFVVEFAVLIDRAGSRGEPGIGEGGEVLAAVGARVVGIGATGTRPRNRVTGIHRWGCRRIAQHDSTLSTTVGREGGWISSMTACAGVTSGLLTDARSTYGRCLWAAVPAPKPAGGERDVDQDLRSDDHEEEDRRHAGGEESHENRGGRPADEAARDNPAETVALRTGLPAAVQRR